MRKQKILLIAVLALLIFPVYVFAKSANAQGNRTETSLNARIRTETQNIGNEIKARVEQKRTELQAQIQQRKEQQMASKSAKLTQLRRDRVSYLFARVIVRYTSAVERLDILTSRIEARVAIIKKESPTTDVSSIESQLAQAKSLLDDSKTKLTATKDNLDNVLNSNDPKTAFQVLKDNLQAIKNELIQTHGILVHVIGDIQGLRVGNTQTMTVTPEPSVPPAS